MYPGGLHSINPCCQGSAVLYFTHVADEETEAEKRSSVTWPKSSSKYWSQDLCLMWS